MAYSKYQYTKAPTWLVRSIYLLGILCWLGVVYGYVHFFTLNKWYWVFMFPFLLVASIYYLLSYAINLFYKKFDVEAHKELVGTYWGKTKKAKLPTIDIFLPVCGESMSLLREVWHAVDNIDYPKDKLNILVLDDHQERDEVKRLAKEFKYQYHARPNKGEMKKAGNLKYGYEHSKSDYIAIFDADCAPHKDFFKELVPYMAGDEKIAIVQSPQYFSTSKQLHLKSALEFGAGHVQEDFYRIIQTSRDHFGGAICVGTNALYRRSALDEVGGTYQIEHSEDVHTGYSLISKGYTLKYVPIIVAQGLCPDDQHSYFKQQFRWCSGSMSLLLSGKMLDRNVTWKQKMCYISGFLYYINHVLILVWPLQLFVLLAFHFGSIDIRYALPFLPYIVYAFIVLPSFRITKPRIGTLVATISYSWAYAMAVWKNVLGGKLEWSPSHSEDTHLWSSEFSRLTLASTIYWLLYVGGIGFFIAAHRFPINNYLYYSVIIWAFYNTFLHGLFMYNNLRYMVKNQKQAVGNDTMSYSSYSRWRMKVLAPVVASILVIVVGTTYFYNNQKIENYMNVHAPAGGSTKTQTK